MRIALLDGPNYLRLSDLSRDSMINSGYEIEGDPGHYVYDFGKPPVITYYWFLGEEFRGDMVSSLCSFLESPFRDLLATKATHLSNCFKSSLFAFTW